jgi:putative acetyltransferase
MTGLTMQPADPGDDGIAPIIAAHLAHSDATTPPESIHAMGIDDLRREGLSFWALYDGPDAVGCGALKPLTDGLVEVKSVHVVQAARGRGLARIIMGHLIDIARQDGHRAMVLETGSDSLPGFDAARGLYETLGFKYCDVIPGYAPDPNSAFMRLDLTG